MLCVIYFQHLLYEDPKRWTFSFNNYALLTRLEIHRHKPVSCFIKHPQYYWDAYSVPPCAYEEFSSH